MKKKPTNPNIQFDNRNQNQIKKTLIGSAKSQKSIVTKWA